jgi:hypothetical protein
MPVGREHAPQIVKRILAGGLAAGTLDILDAFVVAALTGGSPIRVLQAIASGVLGSPSYELGALSASLGLGLHFFISTTAAAVYVLASRSLPILVRRPVACGLVFGLAVWAVMYFLTLPLTFGRPYQAPAWPLLVNQLGIHAVGVGLPIALIASRTVREQRTLRHRGRRTRTTIVTR